MGDLFAAATPLLNQIDTTNLSTVLGELAQASQGEGPKIAASINAGTQLAGLLDRTLNAQMRALQSFAKFTQAIAPAAGDLNNLNAEINAGLPSFNAEEADYENLLNTLIPFSNRLAALLSTYHPDIATILESGDNVSRVLLAQQDSIGQVDQRRLPLLPEDRRRCGGTEQAARRQHVRLLQHLHPLQRRQQPGLQSHRAVDRGHVLPAADSAGLGRQRVGLQLFVGVCDVRCAPEWLAPAAAPIPEPSASATSGASSAAAAAANQAYGMVGQPDQSSPTNLSGIITQLLGGLP